MKMDTKDRIRQSSIRVRSGIKLVTFFAIVTAVAALLLPKWVAEIAAVLGLFFLAITILEYWNVWRLKRRSTEDSSGTGGRS